MNIGETDADGWTYVRFGDAAKAAQDGTHEIEARPGSTCDWAPMGIKDHYWNEWQYRTRVKARTITVTIPRPDEFEAAEPTTGDLNLGYFGIENCKKANEAIRLAMEQS